MEMQPSHFLDDTFWFAMGVVATLISAFVAERVGRLQISFMRKAHDLNVKLAECQIGTDCTMALKAFIPSRQDVRRFIISTIIYNAGDLAARDLKGTWSLSCSQSAYNRSRPIRADFVSKASPYQFDSDPLGDLEITQAISSGSVWIKIDIEFDFSGFDHDKTEHYAAHYEYSHDQRQLVRITDT
jgi:hypothetical protein